MENLQPHLQSALQQATFSSSPENSATLQDINTEDPVFDENLRTSSILFELPKTAPKERFLTVRVANGYLHPSLPATTDKYSFSYTMRTNPNITRFISVWLKLCTSDLLLYTKTVHTREDLFVVAKTSYKIDGYTGTICRLEEVEDSICPQDEFAEKRTQLLQTIITIVEPFLSWIEKTHGKYAKYNPMILYARLCLWRTERTKKFERMRNFVIISAIAIPILSFLTTLFAIYKLTAPPPSPFPFHQK